MMVYAAKGMHSLAAEGRDNGGKQKPRLVDVAVLRCDAGWGFLPVQGGAGDPGS